LGLIVGVKYPNILVKTRLDLERVTAARIKELIPNVDVKPQPYGFKGIVVVYSKEPKRDANIIKENVIEAERVIPALKVVPSNLDEIVKAAKEVISDKISSEETFAVRTVRRGKHDFTSIDVNVKVGAAIKEKTGASVNLDFPDKIITIEIISDYAILSLLPGSEEYKKMKPGKKPILNYLHRIALIQMPYLGPLDAAHNMGVRVGREAQNFEVCELVIAPIGLTPADQLNKFIEGVFIGINSRYQIQRKIYTRHISRVPVYIMDIYQLVRDRINEPIIVFEPEGEPVIKMAYKIHEIFDNKRNKRINVFVGSREGIPVGIYRYADLVLDIAPEVTISTDLAAASAITSLITVLEGET